MATIERSRATLGVSCPIREPSGTGKVVELDEIAPSFSLPSVGGGTFNLAQLRGRKVVLVFLRGFG